MRSASAKQLGLTEDDIDDAIHNHRDSTRLNPRQKAIFAYAEKITLHRDEMGEADYATLREHLSEDEITELGIFMAFNLGFHIFFSTLDFYPMFSPDGELISQEESAAVYGACPVSLVAPEPAGAGAAVAAALDKA